ncbi:MAG TPA: hypothetical protein VNI55_04485 [Gaiellaceae bacterium]|nr:hypothetical protein [Gaiellaceae bacterium]
MIIERRYRGPEDSANGGYAAGLLASYLDGPAEVTLCLPPPLERPLTIAARDGGVVLLDGEALVAEAVRTEVEVDAPPAVGWDGAEAASVHYLAFGADTFRGCFSCGQLRPEGDGLRILPGRAAAADPVAAPWLATEVSVPVVWAAIDCSGAYAVSAQGRGETLLGRMAARIERLPEEGERCVVVGWPLGEDGRKLYAGTALRSVEGSAEGELLAVARQTWIVPR